MQYYWEKSILFILNIQVYFIFDSILMGIILIHLQPLPQTI